MSIQEVNDALGNAAKQFYMHKFSNLKDLSSWKQDFMISVFDILINNSYLARQMKDMAGGVKDMPKEMQAVMEQLKTIAPIP